MRTGTRMRKKNPVYKRIDQAKIREQGLRSRNVSEISIAGNWLVEGNPVADICVLQVGIPNNEGIGRTRLFLGRKGHMHTIAQSRCVSDFLRGWRGRNVLHHLFHFVSDVICQIFLRFDSACVTLSSKVFSRKRQMPQK